MTTPGLQVLERAGLISRTREAQRRPRRLEAKPLAEATGWLENYRKFWENSLERLDELLDEIRWWVCEVDLRVGGGFRFERPLSRRAYGPTCFTKRVRPGYMMDTNYFGGER